MNYAIFLGVMNLILISRLRLVLRDEGINRRDMWIMGGIPMLTLPFFSFNVGWILLFIYLLAYPPLMLFMEKSIQNLNRNRGLLLVVHFLIIGFLSSPLVNIQPNGLSGMIIAFIDNVIVPGEEVSGRGVLQAQALLFGLLMVLNEANIALRYLLQVMGLESLGTKGEEIDQQEYSTGRLIGLLERIFVFLFVLLNQFAAIGFILAAKGVARFQDFKSRTFAEYVLIGTLLSALLAMAVAFVMKVVLTF